MRVKTFLVPLLSLALTTALTGCSDDEPERGGKPVTELTPNENKAEFESIASNVVAQFNPSDHALLLAAINDFGELADYYGLEVDRNATRSVMNTLGDICGDNNLGKMMNFTRASSDLYRAAQYYGIYTYDSSRSRWTMTPADDRLEFRFPSGTRDVVATFSTSGSETTFWRTTDDGEELAVPERATGTITIDGTTWCSVAVTAQLNASAKSAVISANLDATGYTFSCTVNATSTNGSANFKLAKNGTTIIEGNASVNGQRLTDPSYSDENNPQNMFNSAQAYVNIMNEANITATCSNIKDMVDEIDDIDYSYSEDPTDELWCRDEAAIYNRYTTIEVRYSGSSSVIATCEMQAYMEESGYYEWWDIEPVIIFTSDESRYSMEEYFDDELIFGDLIDSFEDLQRQYEDYLDYFVY